MAETVDTAIYRMGLDAAQYKREAGEVARAGEAVVASQALITLSEEKLDRATRTTADGFAKLEARYEPLIRLERQREAALAQAKRFLDEGSVSTERYNAQVARVNQRVNEQIAALGRGGQAASSYRGVIQQAGFQVGDFAVQLASGSNAMVAFTQQGSQLLGFFGPFGAAAGAALAIVGALSVAYFKTGDAAKQALDPLEAYKKAIEQSNDILKTASERAAAAAEQKLVEARQTTATAITIQRENLARLERLKLRREEAAFAAGMAGAPGLDAGVAGELQGRIDEANRVIGELETRFRELASPDAASRQDFDKLRADLDQTAAATARYNAELVAIVDALNAQKISQAEANRLIEQATERYHEQSDAIAGARKTYEDHTKALVAQIDAQLKAEQSVHDLIQGIRVETRELGLSERERAVSIELRKAEALAIQGQIDLTEEMVEQIRREAGARVDAKKALDDEKKAREDAARETERARRELDRTIERSTDRAVDFAADTLYDAFTGRIRSIGEFLRTTLLRATAQAAAEAVFRPILQPVIVSAVQSAPGLFGLATPAGGARSANALGGGVGAGDLFTWGGRIWDATGGGILSSLGLGGGATFSGLSGVSIAGGGSVGGGGGAAAFGIGGGPGAGAGIGVGSALGAAGAGFGIGMLGSQFFGRTGGTIAGGLGGAAAGFLIGGPIGAAIGGVSGLLGGLFGGEDEQLPFAKARGQVATSRGGATVYATETLDGGDTAKLAEGVRTIGEHLRTIAQLTGARLVAGEKFDIVTGRWAGDFSIFGAGQQFSGTPDQAELAYLRFLAQPDRTIRGLSASQSTVFARAPDIETLFSDLNFATTYDDLVAGTTDYQKALRELNRTMDEAADKARTYGFDVAVIERERQKQIEALKAPAQSTALGAVANLRAFLREAQFGPLTALTPEQQIALAGREFDAVAGAAAAGDRESIAALPTYARTFLEAERARSGSGIGFVEAFNRVAEVIAQIAASDPGQLTERAFVAETRTQTEAFVGVVERLKGEVAGLRADVVVALNRPARAA